MKSLIQHINESEIDDIKTYILSLLDEITDDNQDNIKLLKRTKSVLQTSIKDETNSSKMYSIIDNFLSSKNLEWCSKEITDVIINCGDLENFVNIIQDKDCFIDFEELKDIEANKNIIDLIYEKIKNKFKSSALSIKTLRKLALLKPMSKTTTGEFEILLTMFINDAFKPNSGDIGIDNNGKTETVELKSGTAQFKGYAGLQTSNELCDELSNICLKYNEIYNDIAFPKIPFTTEDNCEQFILSLRELYNINNDAGKNVAKKCLNMYKSIYNDYENDNSDFIRRFDKNFIQFLLGEDTQTPELSIPKTFLKFLSMYMLYKYQTIGEKKSFEYLIITRKIDGTNNYNSPDLGNYVFIDMTKNDMTYDEIYNIISELNFSDFIRFDNNNRHITRIDWKKTTNKRKKRIK